MNKHLFVKVADIVSMAIIFICVSSCLKNKSIFLHEVKEFSFNESDCTLTGIPTGLEYEGDIAESLLIDSLLICQVEEPEGYLNVYRLKDFSLKATLCPLGRARNEFSTPFLLLSQYYKKNGDTYILVVDKASYIKEINLTQSLAQGSTIVTDMSDAPSIYEDKTVLYVNNNIRQLFMSEPKEQFSDDELALEYKIVDKANNDIIKIDLFSKPMNKDEEGVSNFSHGPIIKQPNRNMFGQPCSLMDYIIFFDIDNDKVFAAHRTGKPTFDDWAPDGRTLVFSRFAYATNNYLFAEYLKNNEAGRREKYLLVFDWSGNFKAGAKISPSVLSFVYDEKQNALYGWNRSNQDKVSSDVLYKFDLNGFLN
ncbi:MAG: hypothetical protein IKZ89_04785 [Bacteroidaceae bacterium]|nr:hypothetical protein [Bacteroidaceae bacterium]